MFTAFTEQLLHTVHFGESHVFNPGVGQDDILCMLQTQVSGHLSFCEEVVVRRIDQATEIDDLTMPVIADPPDVKCGYTRVWRQVCVHPCSDLAMDLIDMANAVYCDPIPGAE